MVFRTFKYSLKTALDTHAVMSKSVRPKNLTDKILFGLKKKINIPAAYFIFRTDKIFKFSPND